MRPAISNCLLRRLISIQHGWPKQKLRTMNGLVQVLQFIFGLHLNLLSMKSGKKTG